MDLKSKKTLIFIILVIAICILFIVTFMFINNNELNDNLEIGSPEIIILETASSVSTDPPSYVSEFSFNIGQTIWVYQEYTNISQNNLSNFFINISIIHENGKLLSFIEENLKENEKYSFYYFITNSTSWPKGLYLVSSKIVDISSYRTTVKSTSFYLQ